MLATWWSKAFDQVARMLMCLAISTAKWPSERPWERRSAADKKAGVEVCAGAFWVVVCGNNGQ